jgi:hypothetical protein
MKPLLRFSVFIVCLICAFTSLTFGIAEELDQYVNAVAYTNCKANVRKMPSVKSDRVDALSTGTEVTIIEAEESNGEIWCYIQVETPKINGYILLSLLDVIVLQNHEDENTIAATPSTPPASTPAPASSSSATQQAAVYYSGDYGYTVNADSSVEITSYHGNAEKLSVPDTLDGHRVVSVGAYAFELCDTLVSVTLPEGLVNIGEGMFWGCTNLTTVTLPEGLVNIGVNMFGYCTHLTTMTLPEGLVDIGVNAFSGCTNLTSVTLPEGLENIGDYAFSSCENLVSLRLPDNLLTMGDNPFSGTPVQISLSSGFSRYELLDNVLFDKVEKKLISYPYGSKSSKYTVPEGVIAIGNDTFARTNLTSVTLPEGLESIGVSAFSYCANLTSVTLPEGLESIGEGAFRLCNKLTSITLPEGLENLGSEAFYGCEHLVSAKLPDSLVIIGDNPFKDAPVKISLSPNHERFELLDNVLFDKVAKKLISYPFNRKAGKYTVPEGILTIGNYAFADTKITSVKLPDSLKSIGENAFDYCIKLTSVTLPEGLESIGNAAFYNCEHLTSVTLPDSLVAIGDNPFEASPVKISLSSNHARFELLDNVLFDKVEKNLISYPYGDKAKKYTVPEGVLTIGNNAFVFSNLTSVTLPEGLKNIGEFAFSFSNLTSVTLSEGLESIDIYAFSYCDNLTSVNIPASVTSIELDAFIASDKLTLSVVRDSYAEVWVKKYEYPYKYYSP